MGIDDYLDKIEAIWPQPGQDPTKEIVVLCQQAVAEHPESCVLWYDLGIIIQRCDESYGYGAADYLRCFEYSIKCDPNYTDAYQELGYVLDVYYDDYDRAEQIFKTAIELGAEDESYFGLARVLAQMGKTEDAIKTLSESVCPFHSYPNIQKLRSEIIDGQWY